jgi:hypothetical protein
VNGSVTTSEPLLRKCSGCQWDFSGGLMYNSHYLVVSSSLKQTDTVKR